MADYSRDMDPWSYSFNPAAPQYCYWWTYKDFSSTGPKVEVPGEFLPMLVDLYYKNSAKKFSSGKPVQKLRVRWNPKRKIWWTELFPVNDKTTKEWLGSHGYEVKVCKHEDTDKMYRGEMCKTCNRFRVEGGEWH